MRAILNEKIDLLTKCLDLMNTKNYKDYLIENNQKIGPSFERIVSEFLKL